MRDLIKNMLPPVVVNYFTTGQKRTIKIKRNIVFSLAIRCINIAISFLLVPLTIDYVNPTQYGIWITLSSIIAWFSFFDIGFGNGLRNKFAEAVALGKHKLAKIYVSTTYAILGLIAIGAMLLFLVVNMFLNWTTILNTSGDMEPELAATALLVFSFFCIQFVLQLVNVVLTANQEPARAAAFKLVANVLSLGIVFIISKTTSGDLVKLSIALGSAPIVALLAASVVFYKGSYRRYAPHPSYVHFPFAPQLMKLGVKFFIIQVSGIIIYSTDNIIISQLFGPTEVTPYSLAYKYFSTITIVYSIIVSPLWSAITEAYIKKDNAWIRRSMRAMIQIAAVLSIIVIVMILLARPAYRIWIGEDINIPWTLNVLMGLYFCTNLITQPFTYFINGTGKVKLQLLHSLAGAFINIPLALWLASVPSIGINGIMLAVIICTLPGMILNIVQYRKLTNNTATGIWIG